MGDNFDKSKDQMLKRGIIDPYELHPDPNRWVVLEDYVFWSARLQRKITVPRWMHTDLASIPPVVRGIISVNEEHRFAALIHDLGYKLAENSGISKQDWDLLLRDFCIAFNAPHWKYMSMYLAVKWFGDKAWYRYEDMYIPLEHRLWYRTQFPQLNLSVIIDTTKKLV